MDDTVRGNIEFLIDTKSIFISKVAKKYSSTLEAEIFIESCLDHRNLLKLYE